jgi:hypothetical protein
MRQPFLALGLLALLAASWVGAAPSADAHESLNGTVWIGSENLGGYGPLSFTFYGDGKVKMVDARSTVYGSWSQSGTSVFITFANCEYRGTLRGATFDGVAFFTSGPSRVQWGFSVEKL